jgi:hypothetical protein
MGGRWQGRASFGTALHGSSTSRAGSTSPTGPSPLLGAGAELGPLEPPDAVGAHVPGRGPLAQTEAVGPGAGHGSGPGRARLIAPESADGTPGVDLLTQTPEIAAFLRSAAEGCR